MRFAPSRALFLLFTVTLLAACDGLFADEEGDANDSSGSSGSNGSSGRDPATKDAFVPSQVQLRRLQAFQYRAAVRDLLGDVAAAAASPPPDSALNGLDAIGASQLSLSTSDIEEYERSALAATEAAFAGGGGAAIVGCSPKGVDDASCMSEFASRFGRRAFRRSLDGEELSRWTALGIEAANAYGDFHEGARFMAAGLLQSPNFLYQVVAAPAGVMARLSGTEVATRLAFYLSGTLPSEALLAAAENGELDTREGIERHARALLEEPDARTALTAWFDELFRLRELQSLPKDTDTFKSWTPALRDAMRRETLLLLEDVVWVRDADFREIFDAPYTFVDATLAAHYGIDSRANGTARVDLPPATLRGGILGHASLLATMSHTTSSSPTLRGRFIREVLMCQQVPAPPPGVDTTLDPSTGASQTARERLRQHRENPSCAGCHNLMDPLGLGLENFDAVGAFRTTENGLVIDAYSEVPGVGGFAGARELGTLLRNDPSVSRCMVRNLFRHATGHVESAGEEAVIDALEARFAASGYRLQELLVAIAASDSFRFTSTLSEAP